MKFRAITALSVTLGGLSAAHPAAAQSPSCPAFLSAATSLLLVLAPTMAARNATVSHFVRSTPTAPWRKIAPSRIAALGSAGLAWHYAFTRDASRNDPIKREGDMRTPAGIFRSGDTFGRGPVAARTSGQAPAHRDLTVSAPICVDEPSNEQYGQIVERTTLLPGTRGKDMAAEPLYRRGIIIDTPISRADRSGACTFFHVWRAAERPTDGSIALAEADLATLQRLATRDTVVAVLPRPALFRYASCLPSSAD